jgi:hypothetical protein
MEMLGQVPQQAIQTAQAAGAQATAVQVQPVNIAVTISINSPGSRATIVQTNANSAAATAANSNGATQSSGSSKPSRSSSGGTSAGGSTGPSAPSRPATQSNQTAQGAGAQAAAVQVRPVNLAAAIALNSPRSSLVIVQTNANAAVATAANANWTTQILGGQQAGGMPPALLPRGPTAQRAPSASVAIPAFDYSALRRLLGPASGSGGTWNLELTIPGLQVWPFRPPDRPRATPRDRAPSPKDDAGAALGGGGGVGGSGGFTPSSRPAVDSAPDGSSSFVQAPANAREPALGGPILPLRPMLPAPAAGGGTSTPSGLILAALGAALLLASLGLLLGRLGLVSPPWRHQAYLAPLQRPG